MTKKTAEWNRRKGEREGKGGTREEEAEEGWEWSRDRQAVRQTDRDQASSFADKRGGRKSKSECGNKKMKGAKERGKRRGARESRNSFSVWFRLFRFVCSSFPIVEGKASKEWTRITDHRSQYF